MSILGIIASQISGKLTSFDSIATQTVGAGGAASITFSSIPSNYSHLQIRYIARSASTSNNAMINFNSDTGSNYVRHYLEGNGSTAASGANTAQTKLDILNCPKSTDLANAFGGGVIDILDYTNTNKYKTVRTLNGQDFNGTGGFIDFFSGLWLNTAAITSITIAQTGGNNLAQYSTFALYGVK